jgi:hypothetical protein
VKNDAAFSVSTMLDYNFAERVQIEKISDKQPKYMAAPGV